MQKRILTIWALAAVILAVAGYREVCFVGAWWKVPVLVVIAEREYRHPQHEWQTWSLLRRGN